MLSPNSPTPTPQLEAVSFGKDLCLSAHHIPHNFFWTYISLLRSSVLLPGSCSFSSLWLLLKSEAPYEVMITLPFEVFKQRLKEHLLGIEWTVYPWTKAMGPLLWTPSFRELWPSSNCAPPWEEGSIESKGQVLLNFQTFTAPSRYARPPDASHVCPPEYGLCCWCTYP